MQVFIVFFFTLLRKSGVVAYFRDSLSHFRDYVILYFSSLQKVFVMSQIRGSCGHAKASWDNHATCFSCSRCSFETRCSTCKEWTSVIWTLVTKRRTSMGREMSTEDKKKRNMGAPGTLETVSPTVEGSSDNRHIGSRASVGKSLSEKLSQSEKSLGEKYRDNRENLRSDTLRYKGATPD